MFKVKHLMEARESDDGVRIWVEPIGLTADLREWCGVEEILSHVGPTRELWEWFEANPQGYEYFRGKYHEQLSVSPYRPALQAMAAAASRENLTLLHTGDNPNQNTAVALHEYLTELQAYCQPE
jgi:uncharacterized protein YeaO (DUF488 family)